MKQIVKALNELVVRYSLEEDTLVNDAKLELVEDLLELLEEQEDEQVLAEELWVDFDDEEDWADEPQSKNTLPCREKSPTERLEEAQVKLAEVLEQIRNDIWSA